MKALTRRQNQREKAKVIVPQGLKAASPNDRIESSASRHHSYTGQRAHKKKAFGS